MLHKVVQSTQCEETYNLVLGIDVTICLLSAELRPSAVNMSLFGYDAVSNTMATYNNRTRPPSHSTVWFCRKWYPPIPPTPDLYTQLLKKLLEMQTRANGKDGVSPNLTNYPDTDAVKALIQDTVQPLLEKAHTHENQAALDQITAAKIAQWMLWAHKSTGLVQRL